MKVSCALREFIGLLWEACHADRNCGPSGECRLQESAATDGSSVPTCHSTPDERKCDVVYQFRRFSRFLTAQQLTPSCNLFVFPVSSLKPPDLCYTESLEIKKAEFPLKSLKSVREREQLEIPQCNNFGFHYTAIPSIEIVAIVTALRGLTDHRRK